MPEPASKCSLIRYQVIRSPGRRTMCIEVGFDGSVLVRAPMRAAEWRIERLVRDKAPWVLKQLSKMPGPRAGRRFADGDSFPYLGRDHRLRVVLNGVSPKVRLENDELVAFVSAAAEDRDAIASAVKQALLSWYLQQAESFLAARLCHLKRETGLRPSKVRIKAQVHRWGSCSAKGSLNLNWKLVMAPPAVADYVIIHELCHLRFQDHSRRFWDLVGSFVPDHRQQRKWLRENGRSLEI